LNSRSVRWKSSGKSPGGGRGRIRLLPEMMEHFVVPVLLTDGFSDRAVHAGVSYRNVRTEKFRTSTREGPDTLLNQYSHK